MKTKNEKEEGDIFYTKNFTFFYTDMFAFFTLK